MSRRIHELAREWGVQPKDLLATLEKVGIRGKRSQSSLADDEVQRVHDVLGLGARPRVVVGTERVVAERVVTERDAGGDHLVTAREQTTETRLPPAAGAREPAARGAPPTVPAGRPAVARPAPGPVPAPPPPGFEEMRGVKVLGKIDLRRPTAPAPSPVRGAAEPAPSAEPAAG